MWLNCGTLFLVIVKIFVTGKNFQDGIGAFLNQERRSVSAPNKAFAGLAPVPQ
jgi:hypothetical protein